MIRSELVQKIADENPELGLQRAEQVLHLFFNEIEDRLKQGGRVELRGFGIFTTRARNARTGRNPKTGETVDVRAKHVVNFKPGKAICARLNKKSHDGGGPR